MDDDELSIRHILNNKMNSNFMNLFLSVFLVMLTACGGSAKTEDGTVVFTRDDFAETRELVNPEEIIIDSLLNPASFHVLRDSVLVVSNQDNCEYMLELYSLNTHEPLARLARKGNGPEDMLSCSAIINSASSSKFGLQDWNATTYYTVDLDTLLQTERLSPLSKFRYSSEILQTVGLCPLDEEHYIGYNMWYLDDEAYTNVPEPLTIYEINQDSGKDMGDFSSFVASVNGASMFRNPQSGELWTLDLHRDLIQIYNDSLQVIRTIQGPDAFAPKYIPVESPAPINFISFADDYEYRTYSDYFLTDKHLYLVYVGDEHFNPEEMGPVEIFKLDYEGNLLCRYLLDRYVYSISVDASDKYLYAASRESVKELPVLLKYTL